MKLLIIPDIHGRHFWKDAIKVVNSYDKIIFLGDYMDPYPHEKIDVGNALENFKDIIDFTKKHLDKVILLLGNHDFYYYYELEGPSRWSWKYHHNIENIFKENKDLFNIAYETKNALITHAGFIQKWATMCQKFFNTFIEPTAESLNSLLYNEEILVGTTFPKGEFALKMVSRERGGHYSNGSCIWADVNEHYYNGDYEGKYQIFGHTMQLDLSDYYINDYDESQIKFGEAIITDNFAMLDNGQIYEYDDENKSIKPLCLDMSI